MVAHGFSKFIIQGLHKVQINIAFHYLYVFSVTNNRGEGIVRGYLPRLGGKLQMFTALVELKIIRARAAISVGTRSKLVEL